MEQQKPGQKPETERKEGAGSVLSDKEKFGDTHASEDLKHMGEKTREASQEKK